MRDLILSLPAQIPAGSALGAAQKIERPYRSIISCGMGGSAIAGEILSMVKDDVIVHWDYDLPVGAGGQDLVICTSWSGNTEETISSYRKARELGMETLTITGGGTLAELAQKDGSPCIVLPQANPVPRANVGLMTGALFGALGLAEQLPQTLDAAALEASGKDIATAIGDKTLALYASYPWRKLTGFWKMAYSETAKRQVFVNWFPSGAHTEVVGWEGPYQDQIRFLILRDDREPARYTKNFDALLAILEKKRYTVRTASLSGNTLLEKVFNSYILALWTGFHVATDLGIDPQATELLDEFKRLKA